MIHVIDTPSLLALVLVQSSADSHILEHVLSSWLDVAWWRAPESIVLSPDSTQNFFIWHVCCPADFLHLAPDPHLKSLYTFNVFFSKCHVSEPYSAAHSRLVLSPFITVVANYFCFVFLTIYSWVVVERGQQDHGIILLRYVWNQSYAWFPPFRCHSAVAVSPLPLRKFRKNYVSAVRITLLMWKIPLRRCRFHLPLRRNCHSVAIAFWSLHPYVYGKTFPAFPFSPAMATVATEWKNGNDTTAMAEPQPLSLTFPVAVNQSINQLIFIVA